jgi:predicted alpha/beta superfamily hydrolase
MSFFHLLLAAQVATAADAGSPVTIGKEYSLHSKVLGEDRKVLVWLPDTYDETRQGYPVLYLLDGAAHFHHVTGIVHFLADKRRIPETIVVGVPNTDRTRDLTTPTRDPEDGERNVGGADRFLEFLAAELVPWVEARWRTQPFRILQGHSLGGLFAVKALLDRPDVFPNAIAVSPSLWWDRESLTPLAKAGLGRTAARRFLYFTSGDHEEWIRDSTKKFAAMLRQSKPAGLDWHYEYMPTEDHGTTPHRTTYAGLEALFKDFLPRKAAEAGDWGAVEAHFKEWSKRLGFALPPSPALAEWVGQQLIEKKRHAEAEPLLRKNLDENPRRASAMAALAECLMGMSRLDEAEPLLVAAVARGREKSDPDLYWYSDLLMRLRNKRATVGTP